MSSKSAPFERLVCKSLPQWWKQSVYVWYLDASTFNDDDWQRVATADVEDDGKFYEYAIYEHKTGGGHCLYFGEDEYEGVGEDGACGTHSFQNGLLLDSDGDVISARNVAYGRMPSRDYAPSSESSGDSDSEEYAPSSRVRGRGRGRGSHGRGGRGRGRASGRGRGRALGRTSGRGRARSVLPVGQYECSSCHVRSVSIEVITQCHDRHFPWCDKYDKNQSCDKDINTEVAKAEVSRSLIHNNQRTQTCTHIHIYTMYIMSGRKNTIRWIH